MVKQREKFRDKSIYKNEIDIIVNNVTNNQLDGYKPKKLEGYRDIFSIRKGKIRIIFRKKD